MGPCEFPCVLPLMCTKIQHAPHAGLVSRRNAYSTAFSEHSLCVPLRFWFASYQSAMCPLYRYRGFCRVLCVFAVCSPFVSSCNFITFSPALSCVPLYSPYFPCAFPCVTRPFLLVVPSFVSRALPMQSGWSTLFLHADEYKRDQCNLY